MKKAVLIILTVVLIPCLIYAGLNFGLPGAVKSKVKELDRKVRDKQETPGGTGSQSFQNVYGTVAKGRPIISAPVSLKDAYGSPKSTTTDSNGKYIIDVTGLTFPMLLEVTDGTTIYFSIAYTSGTCNIHPLTDLIVRSYFWFNEEITDLDSAFQSSFTSLGTLPTAEDVSIIETIIENIIIPVLAREGSIDPETYNVFTTSFDADSTGFDQVIEEIQITIDTSSSTVTIEDTVAGVVISSFSYTPSASSIIITKVAPNPIELSVTYDGVYNILLARANGGNPPYTFLLDTGVGFQPMGMTLFTTGNSCYLTGKPSEGSESPFTRQFGLCVKDLGGFSDCVSPYFQYTVTKSPFDGNWSGNYNTSHVGVGDCTYNSSGVISFTLSVTGASATGPLSVTGVELIWIPPVDPCVHAKYTTGTGTINGTISDNAITGTYSYEVPEDLGTANRSYTATLSGDTLTGDISISGSPAGTFTVTRQSSGSSSLHIQSVSSSKTTPDTSGRLLGN